MPALRSHVLIHLILAGYFDEFHLAKYGINPRCVEPARLAAILNEVAPGKPAMVLRFEPRGLAGGPVERETERLALRHRIGFPGRRVATRDDAEPMSLPS